jgi:hypothetical protein
MPKTKIEDLPRLEDLDPEDQCLIRGGRGSASFPAVRRRPQLSIAPTPEDTGSEGDIIVSRLPPGA